MEIDLQAGFNLAILQKIDGQDGRRPHRIPAAGVRMHVPRWQVERENVGVDVDLHGKTKRPTLNAQRSTLNAQRPNQNGLTGSGCGIFLPHLLQVRRASSLQKSSIVWLKCSTISPQSKSMSSTNAPQLSQ